MVIRTSSFRLSVLVWILTLPGSTMNLPDAGEEACMQIYTVPKRIVQCEPNAQTKQDLDFIMNTITQHTRDIRILKSHLQLSSKVKVKRFPCEFKKKDNTASQTRADPRNCTSDHVLQEILALHSEVENLKHYFKHDTSIQKLIETQLELMKQFHVNCSSCALMSDKITDLVSKMSELEKKEIKYENHLVSLNDSLRHLAGVVEEHHQEEVVAKKRLTEVTQHLSVWQEQISQESRRISVLEDRKKTVHKDGDLEEKRDSAKGEMHQLKTVLSEKLSETLEQKWDLEKRTTRLEGIVAELQKQMTKMREDMEGCLTSRNDSSKNPESGSGSRNDTHALPTPQPQIAKVTDCQEIRTLHSAQDGVYSIFPDKSSKPFQVFCEMTPDGYGWTVIQRRYHGEVDFFRGWAEYEDGFGDIRGEFWLGLKKIHTIIRTGSFVLQVDLQDFEDNWYFAFYADFSIEEAEERYRLHVSGFKGNIGDALSYHNGMNFSTHDLEGPAGACARVAHGGWWYNDCHLSNLNGRYYDTGKYWTTDGIVWKKKNDINFKPFKSTIMRIRPIKKN